LDTGKALGQRMLMLQLEATRSEVQRNTLAISECVPAMFLRVDSQSGITA
jgi:hypothetical protein